MVDGIGRLAFLGRLPGTWAWEPGKGKTGVCSRENVEMLSKGNQVVRMSILQQLLAKKVGALD